MSYLVPQLTRDGSLDYIRKKARKGITQVGNAKNEATMFNVSMDRCSDVGFVTIDQGEDGLSFYEWNGTDFTLQGSRHSFGSITTPYITALDATDVAVIAAGVDLERWTFNGSTWSQEGSSLVVSTNSGPIAALSDTEIAMAGGTLVRLFTWGGASWSQTSSLTVTSQGTTAVTAMNATDIVVVDTSTDSLKYYRHDFNANTWVQVGNSYSITNPGAVDISRMNETDVVFNDITQDDIRVFRWNGTDFELIFEDNRANTEGVCGWNENQFVIWDATSREFIMYKFDDDLSPWQKLVV